MWNWIKSHRSESLQERVERRKRSAREAVADKHEKEGERDLRLGERTRDHELIKTGHERLSVAQRLRSNEMSLLEALNLDVVDDDDA